MMPDHNPSRLPTVPTAEIKRQQLAIEDELIPFVKKLQADGWEPAIVGGTLVGLGCRLFRECQGSGQAVELLETMAAEERQVPDDGGLAGGGAPGQGLH